MSIMENTLEKIKKSGELAIFIVDNMPSDDSYWGVLIDYNTEYIYLSLITMDGHADGITVFPRADLTRIRWATPKISSVQKLFDRNASKLCRPNIDIRDINTVLTSTQGEFGYVGLYIERLDDDALLLGELSEIDNSHAVIAEFANKEDTVNSVCSHCIVGLDDITSVVAGDVYNEDILYLNKNT